MIGETLSNFRVISEIGRGGMATVYLGEHHLIGTRAAIKVLLPLFCREKEIVARFFNEAKAAGRIKHPGVIEIYDFGYRDTDGTAYIIMEFVAGESLDQRIHRVRNLQIDSSLIITRHVASCLSHAHDTQIIHRDLKPENIMLTPDSDVPGGERVKLLDFGIAKLLDAAGKANGTTRAGAVLGTPAYMAPEQSGNAANVDSRADLYALGCVLYEMLVGQPPFPGTTVGELLIAHRIHIAPPPSQHAAGIPPEVDRLVATLLAKDPSRRIQSGRELVSRIDQLCIKLGLAFGTSPGNQASLGTDALPLTVIEEGPSLSDSQATIEESPSLRDSQATVLDDSQAGAAPYRGRPAERPLSDSQATVLRDSQAGAPYRAGLAGRPLSGHASYGHASQAGTIQLRSPAVLWSALVALALATAVAAFFLFGGTEKDSNVATHLDAGVSAANSKPLPADAAPIDAKGEIVATVTIADAAPPPTPAIDAAQQAPKTYEVRVRSRPSKASVYIEGRKVGTTPHNLEFEKGSSVEVMLKSRGYRDRVVTIDDSKSKIYSLSRIPKHAKPDNKPDKPDEPDDGNKSVNPFD